MNHIQTATSRYLIQRLQQNAQWYEQKSALNQAFCVSKKDASLFEFLFILLNQHLQEGHTVLAMTDKLVGDERLLAVMPAWQTALFSPAMSILGDFLPNPPDFMALFGQMQQLLHRQVDNTVLADWSQEALRQYRSLLLSIDGNIRQVDKEQLLHLFLMMFRVYYLLSICKNKQDFLDILQKNLWFAQENYHDLPSKLHINPPIIYGVRDEGVYLWLNRAYQAEQGLLSHIWRISSGQVMDFAIDGLPDFMNTAQKQAVALVSKQPFALIIGGPGTGKTFTVAQIVLSMYRQFKDNENTKGFRLVLSAPTGKAAQRMSESLQQALDKAGVQIALPKPKTIHRLLGIGNDGVPRHHQHNPLPDDMIIIDEASMLGVELAHQLLSAVKTGARLVLLGDANQLAAVDAGAVLADLCKMPSLQQHLVALQESRRFGADSGVGRLAALVHEESTNPYHAVMALTQDYADVRCHALGDIDVYETLAQGYQMYFEQTAACRWRFAKLSTTAQLSVVQSLMATLSNYRILCASHQGKYGDETINQHLVKRHKAIIKALPSASAWYHGRVVMITKNRYDLGLYNGDVGICLYGASGLVVYFEGDEERAVSVDLLDGQVVIDAYAITVHKSQGSEWRQVAIVFDEQNHRLLSKELIYTAITRAKSQVDIYSTPDAINLAIATPTIRQTGLEKLV